MDPHSTIHIQLPASFKYLDVLGACIESMFTHTDGVDTDAETIYGIQLALHEICINIVEHAYGQAGGEIAITFSLDLENRCFTAETCDSGQPFDRTSLVDPDLETPQVRGYGLYIVRQLMDEISYSAEHGQNTWRLLKWI